MRDRIVSDVDVLIIGGGAIGTSIALHLAEHRTRSVQLLERFSLSEGTSWHSAGMVGQLRSKAPIMSIIQRSATLYDHLETAHPGLIDFRRTGSLRLATTDQRIQEMERQSAQARGLGIDASMIDPPQIAAILPTMDLDGMISACWIPTDGYVDPERLAVGLGQLAAEAGATIVEGVEALDVHREDNRWFVTTTAGEVRATDVVIAGGMHSTVIAARAGVFVPIVCSRQQLVASKSIDPEVADYPTLREPERSMIMRPRDDALVIGSYAEDPEIEFVEDVPVAPRFTFEPEFIRMAPVWQAACDRFPQIAQVGEAETLKGPEGITPDGELILGPSGQPGLWIAAGGSGHGIAAAGGVGWAMSSWILTGEPPLAMGDFALDRFDPGFAEDRDSMLAAAREHEIGHYALQEAGE